MRTRTTLVLAFGLALLLPGVGGAEVCTTQSQMTATERDAMAAAAKGFAAQVQSNDAAGLRTASVAELAKDFNGLEYVVGNLSPKLKGGTLQVEQVYLLDGSNLKGVADAQFFCSLNQSMAEVDFTIPSLPSGKYGFAIVDVKGASVPWRLSLLMRQEQGRWMLAGFYPKATTAAGHDGLWYWTEARQMVKRKENWNAWLYYQEAEGLLRPVGFLQSTHLEKLQTEQTAAAPPVLSEGVSAETPLVVKGSDGVEYRFTGLGVDDSLGGDKVDVAAHLQVSEIGDPAAARKRNTDAMSALLGAYPELRKPFHGVWMYAEVKGQNPFATEQAISDIH
jgi:hypothetical protein